MLEIDFPVDQILAVAQGLEDTGSKDLAYYMTNIMSRVVKRAVSKQNTPAVSASKIRADMNKAAKRQRKFRNRAGRSVSPNVKVKHMLALASIKASGGNDFTWEKVQEVAESIVRYKLRSKDYLRSGWINASRQIDSELRRMQNRFVERSRTGRGFGRLGADGRTRRLGDGRVSRRNLEILARNKTASLVSTRSVDPARFIYSNGNPSSLSRIGMAGLSKAARAQLATERKSIVTRLSRTADLRIQERLRSVLSAI